MMYEVTNIGNNKIEKIIKQIWKFITFFNKFNFLCRQNQQNGV